MPYKKTPAGIPPDHKWCFSCSTATPRADFKPDRHAKDGLHYCCPPCSERKRAEAAQRRRMFAELYRRLRVD